MAAVERESLFMLEVVVDEVAIPGITCRYPAVAVRLMDFPTLMVHHADDRLIRKIQINLLQKAQVPRQFIELQDENGNFAFQKGKSCIFKISAQNLRLHLSNTPLYILVVDTYPEIPKLIASCVLPLCQSMEKIFEHVVSVGLAVPETDGTRGKYALRNLMGVNVGHIVFGYRLISLGEGLLQHVPKESLVVSKSEFEKEGEIADPQMIPERDVKPEIKEKPIEKEEKRRKKLSKSKPEVLDITKVQHIFAESVMNREFTDEGTQTEPPRKHAAVATHETEEELLYRPPPLFYNANGEEKIPKPLQKSYTGFDYETDVESVVDEESAGIMYHSPDVLRIPRQEMQYADLQRNLAQFPVISALMNELQRIQGAAFPSEQSAFQKVHPKKPTSDEKRAQTKSKDKSRDNANEKRAEFLERISKPKCREENLIPVASPRDPVPKSSSWIRKEPVVGVKKSKLEYGMTRTQRLRLRMNNPTLVESQESNLKSSVGQYQLEILANLGQTKTINDSQQTKPIPSPRKHVPVRHSFEFDKPEDAEEEEKNVEENQKTLEENDSSEHDTKQSSVIHIPVADVNESDKVNRIPPTFPGFNDEEDEESSPVKDTNVRDSLIKIPVINPKASKNSPISGLRASQAFTARSEVDNNPVKSAIPVSERTPKITKSVSFDEDDTNTKVSSDYEPSYLYEPSHGQPRRISYPSDGAAVRPLLSEESFRTDSVSSYAPSEDSHDKASRDSEYSDDFEVDIPMSPTQGPSLPRVSHMGYTY